MHCHAALPCEHHYPNTTSSYAAEGTVAHMVCEEALKGRKRAIAFVGMYGDGSEEFKDEPLYHTPKLRSQFEFEVTHEMASAVQIFLDAVNAEFEIWQLQGLNPVLNVEVGFSLEKVMDRDDMFGTNDASVWVPGHYLLVGDYKHGKGELVEVEDNSQLKYYALGALIELCWDGITGWFDEDLFPERVELMIGQPRAAHANGPIRRWECTPLQLVEDFVREMKEDVTVIDKLFAMFPNIDKMTPMQIMEAMPIEHFAPGEWCKWCKAKAGCKGIYLEAQRAITANFEDGGLSLEELGDMIEDKTAGMVTKSGKNKGSPSAKLINAETRIVATELARVNIDMDGEKLKRLLNAATLFELLAKAIRQQAYNQVTQGAKIPGYKMVRQGTKRRYTNVGEVKETLSLFLSEDQYMEEPELKSFTDIEKLSKEAADLIVGLTEVPEGALVLAKESDKREAVTPSAADAFEGDELDVSDLE